MTRLPVIAALLVVVVCAAVQAQQGAPAVPAAGAPPAVGAPAADAAPPADTAPGPQTSAAPAGPVPARTVAQQPAFRAGIDIVSLNVTVTDQQSRYVTDLAQEDFSVDLFGTEIPEHETSLANGEQVIYHLPDAFVGSKVTDPRQLFAHARPGLNAQGGAIDQIVRLASKSDAV